MSKNSVDLERVVSDLNVASLFCNMLEHSDVDKLAPDDYTIEMARSFAVALLVQRVEEITYCVNMISRESDSLSRPA